MTLKRFSSEDLIFRHLPCRLYLQKKKPRPLANKDYLVSNATLLQIAPYYYILKPEKTSVWQPIESSFSFAEWRYQLKEKIRHQLKNQFSDRQVYSLISALVTGDLESRFLAFQFRRIGLQHLLVISGFHFALLSLLLIACIRSYFSQQTTAFFLIFFLGMYAFYLGSAPSISRAWVVLCLFLIARYLSYRFSILNALGLALLYALIESPFIVFNIGFQLSFAATLGILLLYAPLEKFFRLLLPKRSFAMTLDLLPFDRLGYLIASYLRKIFALNSAVLLFTLPLILLHFQKFPLLSLIYNLFFPPLFSLMLILALLSPIFPFLSSVTTFYAQFLLHLITHTPRRFALYLHVQSLTPKTTLILFAVLLTFGIPFYQKNRKNSGWV